MNIAIMCDSLKSGGAERIAGLLSKELAKNNNVYVFLVDTKGIVYEYGGQIVNIGRCGALYEYPIKYYKKLYNIDVAISFMETMNFANIRTSGKEKVIISERCVQSRIKPEMISETYKIRKLYNYADAIVACSEGVKYDLEKNYAINSDIKTIYNFVNKEEIIDSSREEMPSYIKEFVGDNEFFVNVGRLHIQKNQERLIRQFSVFHNNTPNIKLVILGSGEEKEHLQNVINELNLQENVGIFDYVSNPFSIMAHSKALILASDYEGLPNVIIESMVLGCPIIATDCLAGPRELLADKLDYVSELEPIKVCSRGIIVTNADSENRLETTYMAEAMKLLCDYDELVNCFKAEQGRFAAEYDNSELLSRWMEVISGISKKDNEVLKEEMTLLLNDKKTFIYGAGVVGRSYYLRLARQYAIEGFVVSKRSADQGSCYELPIFELDELQFNNDDVQFVIGVSEQFQTDVLRNLGQKGYTNYIFPDVEPFGYEYYMNGDYDFKSELCLWYKWYVGEDLNIDNPVTYNEKIQWLKLYDNLPIKKTLADKISVRSYVEEKIGNEYLIPLLGVWHKYDEIAFDSLPNQFVLKCNTGSGFNYVVKDKNVINHNEVRRMFDEWQSIKYEYMSGLEMHYSGIESFIIAEKLLDTKDGSDLKDYKLFVFDGKVKLIQVDIDRQHIHRRNLYTPDWEYLPYSILYPTAPDVSISRPDCLEELISVAEKLGQGFRHVRADFYISDNKIYFGELTFTHGSGTEKFTPSEFGVEMGTWINIGEK